MAGYVISDIHGEYVAYREMLRRIELKPTDTLFVLGDILDRGPEPVEVALDLMERPNAVCLAGNHELMALECMRFLLREVTESALSELSMAVLHKLANWQYNGCRSTVEGFRRLRPARRREVLEFIAGFDLYAETEAGGTRYVLVHAGLGNFDPERALEDYELDELIWERPDYERAYFPDRFVVTGHTPTLIIPGNPRPGYIFRKNNHIAVDCGAVFGGRLGCLCLDTGEEFYVETGDRNDEN